MPTSYSPTVRGSEGSSIVVRTSTKGTSRMAACSSKHRMFLTTGLSESNAMLLYEHKCNPTTDAEYCKERLRRNDSPLVSKKALPKRPDTIMVFQPVAEVLILHIPMLMWMLM